MKCPRCQHENPSGAKVCVECASPITQRCPACSTEAPPAGEVLSRVRRARGVRVNEGHCPAHGKTIPHPPLLEMLRDIFGIAERDTDHEARRKIAGELLLLDDAFQELLPILFDFMGVADPTRPALAMTPEGRQQKLFAFVRHLSEARSARESLDLALEVGRANQMGGFMNAYYVAALAEAHLGLGDEARAREFAAEAIDTAAHMQMPVAEARGQLALARVLRVVEGADGSAAIPAALDRALTLVQSTGERSYEPQISVERARLAALRLDASEAQQWLCEAHRLFTEMGAKGHAERLAQELGS